MLLFKKVYYRASDVWKWLFTTIALSGLPIAISLMVAINKRSLPSTFDQYVNLNDLIFMGLSISITNKPEKL